jgi:hypothetical protein
MHKNFIEILGLEGEKDLGDAKSHTKSKLGDP